MPTGEPSTRQARARSTGRPSARTSPASSSTERPGRSTDVSTSQLGDRDRAEDLDRDPREHHVVARLGPLQRAREQRRGRPGVLMARVPRPARALGGAVAPVPERDEERAHARLAAGPRGVTAQEWSSQDRFLRLGACGSLRGALLAQRGDLVRSRSRPRPAPRRCARRARAGRRARSRRASRTASPASPAGRRRPSRGRGSARRQSTSSSSRTGSRQQSCSALNASHSARVRAASTASTAACAGDPGASNWCSIEILTTHAAAERGPELRLQRAHRDVAVGAARTGGSRAAGRRGSARHGAAARRPRAAARRAWPAARARRRPSRCRRTGPRPSAARRGSRTPPSARRRRGRRSAPRPGRAGRPPRRSTRARPCARGS